MVFPTFFLLQAAKRIPLIKFRASQKVSKSIIQTAGKSSAKAATSKGKASAQQKPAIDDIDLPKRYARKLMSKTEMEYINRGGPP